MFKIYAPNLWKYILTLQYLERYPDIANENENFPQFFSEIQWKSDRKCDLIGDHYYKLPIVILIWSEITFWPSDRDLIADHNNSDRAILWLLLHTTLSVYTPLTGWNQVLEFVSRSINPSRPAWILTYAIPSGFRTFPRSPNA